MNAPWIIKQWKYITYPLVRKGMYMISNFGEIYSTNAGTLMNLNTLNTNYLSVVLACEDGKPRNFLVHRLVAYEFCNPPLDFQKYQVNHKDACKIHNTENNLEWVTRKENMKHASDNGLNDATRGENNYFHVLNEDQAIRIRDILKEVGLDENNPNNYDLVGNIKRKVAWKHITEGYDFSNRNGKMYPNNIIESICKMISKGKSIADIYMAIEGKEYENSKKNKRFYEYIRRIKNKEQFKEISDKYF